MNDFPCNRCGLCCQHVGLAPETRFLDRGDGACRHLDTVSKDCRIYEQRPDICRVDRQYTLNYSRSLSWEQYVALNLEVCSALQARTSLITTDRTTPHDLMD
jgi:Fe-S-cluster containining protein